MSAYAWIITNDLLNIMDANEPHAIGTVGPSDSPDTLIRKLKLGEGEPFRMLDDDRNLYYEGRIIHAQGYEGYDTGFEPLDDFGTPNDGCTIIQYRSTKTGQWEDL